MLPLSYCLVIKLCLTLSQHYGVWSLPGSSVHGISQARILAWVAIHFLHHGIFSTGVLNSGLLHCRQILYLLTHKALGIRKKKMGSIEDSGKHHQKIFKAFNTFLFTSIYFKIELHKISLGPWLSVSFFGWRKYTLERLNDLPKVTQLFCGTIRLRNQVS